MKNILYIEDNELDRAYVKDSFDPKEVNIIACEDYESSKPYIEKSDLIIIDINLFLEDGYDVYAKIKKDYPEKQYIITSGTVPDSFVSMSENDSVVGKNKLEDFIKKWLCRDGNI